MKPTRINRVASCRPAGVTRYCLTEVRDPAAAASPVWGWAGTDAVGVAEGVAATFAGALEDASGAEVLGDAGKPAGSAITQPTSGTTATSGR